MDLFDIAMIKKFGGGGGGGDGYVLTDADKAEIAEQAAALVPGGGGGVSSWNDLTDKPFGEDDNAVLLPPTQFAYDSAFGLFAVPGYIDFMIGKTYTVNWNGVEYTTEAVPGQFNGEDLVMIGNPAALGGANNNLPFAIACLMGSIGAIPLDGSTAVNVGITGYFFKKIPVKYMPSMQYRITIPIDAFSPNEVNENVLQADIKYDTTELVDAVLEGRNLYLVVINGLLPTRETIASINAIFGGDTLEESFMGAANAYGKDKVPVVLAAASMAGGYIVTLNYKQ